jgi:predicted alpha/beta hydrolase family esterase
MLGQQGKGRTMATLELIAAPDEDKPHLVFVHGLGGDARETWMHDARDPATLWPAWIAEDSGCPTWLLGYDAALSGWADNAMPLPQQGTSVLERLSSEPRLRGRDIVLIGHSLGGLVIKTALINGTTTGVARYETLVAQVKGVVFVATPHFGAELATLAHLVRIVLRSNDQVGDMKLHNAHLATLNNQFRALCARSKFKVRIYAETRGVTTARRLFALRGPAVRVVNDTSSDPGVPGEIAIPLPEDHFSICKPEQRSAQIHDSLLSFLAQFPSAVGIPAAAPVTVVRSSEAATAQPGPTPGADVERASPPGPAHVQLAIARWGLSDPDEGMGASACVVSEDPEGLRWEIEDWKPRLLRDPLLTEAARARIRGADLGALVLDAAVGGRVLDWLSVTSFSAYLNFAPRAAIDGLRAAEIDQRFVVSALSQRLRKKSQLISAVHADAEDVQDALTAAVRRVRDESGRSLEVPRATHPLDRQGRTLVALATLIARAACRHLARPDDEQASVVFEHLRTRIRFAMDVATGEVHTRDRNPLP